MQLVALTAQLQQFELKNQALTRKVANKPNNKDTPKTETNNRTNNRQDGYKWAWKVMKPKGKKPDTKTVNGNNYWF